MALPCMLSHGSQVHDIILDTTLQIIVVRVTFGRDIQFCIDTIVLYSESGKRQIAHCT